MRVKNGAEAKKELINGINHVVDAVASTIVEGGKIGSSMQSGNLSKSLKWMGFGLLVLLVLVLIFSDLK